MPQTKLVFYSRKVGPENGGYSHSSGLKKGESVSSWHDPTKRGLELLRDAETIFKRVIGTPYFWRLIVKLFFREQKDQMRLFLCRQKYIFNSNSIFFTGGCAFFTAWGCCEQIHRLSSSKSPLSDEAHQQKSAFLNVTNVSSDIEVEVG